MMDGSTFGKNHLGLEPWRNVFYLSYKPRGSFGRGYSQMDKRNAFFYISSYMHTRSEQLPSHNKWKSYVVLISHHPVIKTHVFT